MAITTSSPSTVGSSLDNSLPYTGQAVPQGSAEAVVISPAVQNAAAVDPGNGSFGQSLFWLLMGVFVGIPTMIVMTLIATVLIRR